MKIIKVNQVHIDRGNRKSIGQCPVNLAIREVMPDIRVNVHGLNPKLGITAFIDDQVTPLPNNVVERIVQFDLGNGMEPFEFEL